jgi:eukaryotic-like serine/threonine-protein kinase
LRDRKASWGFAEGDEIAPGRRAVHLLGGGRRYEAYLAWDDDLHALMTVKVVRPARLGHQGTLDGLAGEARALDALQHPSLVRGFDAVLDGERPHLVLEFLEGPRLSTYIRREVVAIEQVLSLALQLASVLHYVGRREWVHLDVKPRNVIMAGPPRLIDLSVARPVGEARRDAGPIGTAAYMAPEQCDPGRSAEIGPAADVWGLGATVYELAAGRRAFADPRPDAERLADRYPQLAEDPAPLPPRTPAPVAAAIRACLERRPADRPAAAELAADLEPVVDALPRPRLGLFRPGGRRRMQRLA